MLETLFRIEQTIIGGSDELLQDRSLANLRKYKYRSTDTSPTSKYILNPFWTWSATFMPRWLAPNVITLIGISAIFLCNFIVIFWCSDFRSALSRPVYLFFAVSLFFYQTMDNIDGKQARATGTSSPLGELFDHGIDSLNCVLGAIVLCASLTTGSTPMAAVSIVAPMIGMYFSTWETYYTHTLYLGFVNAPTEGLLVAVAFHLGATFYGAEWGSLEIFGIPVRLWWYLMLVSTLALIHIPSCVLNVHRYIHRTEDEPSTHMRSAIFRLGPILLIVLSCYIWLSGPNSRVLSESRLLAFGWLLMFVVGRTTTSVILSHLCLQQLSWRSLPLALLCIGAALFGVLPRIGLAIPIDEIWYLHSVMVFNGIYFLLYSKLVIDRITNYLGIRCFTVPST